MKKIIKLGLLLGWMALIFMFSAENASASTDTSNNILNIIYKIYNYIFANKISLDLFIENNTHLIRKLAHFSEFTILGILAYLNAREYFNKYIVVSIIFSCLYAISDEVHQLFIENRSCEILDMSIDSLGAILGIVVCHLLIKRCLKKDV